MPLRKQSVNTEKTWLKKSQVTLGPLGGKSLIYSLHWKYSIYIVAKAGGEEEVALAARTSISPRISLFKENVNLKKKKIKKK